MVERIIADCTGRDGSVDTDAVARAILQYRNTPISHINKSPAQLLRYDITRGLQTTRGQDGQSGWRAHGDIWCI